MAKRKITFEEVKLAREDRNLRAEEYYSALCRVTNVTREYVLDAIDRQLGDWVVNPNTGVEFKIVDVWDVNTDGSRALIHGRAGVNDVDFWVELKKQ